MKRPSPPSCPPLPSWCRLPGLARRRHGNRSRAAGRRYRHRRGQQLHPDTCRPRRWRGRPSPLPHRSRRRLSAVRARHPHRRPSCPPWPRGQGFAVAAGLRRPSRPDPTAGRVGAPAAPLAAQTAAAAGRLQPAVAPQPSPPLPSPSPTARIPRPLRPPAAGQPSSLPTSSPVTPAPAVRGLPHPTVGRTTHPGRSGVSALPWSWGALALPSSWHRSRPPPPRQHPPPQPRSCSCPTPATVRRLPQTPCAPPSTGTGSWV